MSSSFMLEILTPEASVYWGRATSVTVKAIDGEVQVLSGHAPYVNLTVPGDIRVNTEDERSLNFKGGRGIVEVARDKTSILYFND
jgi:F-type H+-transporting ATPase subunit epsilon